MSNLKSYTGKELIAILESIGFNIERTRGSHHFLRHQDGRTTVIPMHKGETIGIGLFMKILKDIEIPKEEFMKIKF